MVQVGYNTTSELWDINYKRMARFVNKILSHINIEKGSKCVDMGEANPKMEYIKEQLGIEVEQLAMNDFNFDFISQDEVNVIFALEVVEHLQNPLFFMSQLKSILKDDGSIFVTMPCNPRWLWVDGHYHEIPPKHFDKWILKPLNLKIEKYKRIHFVHDWKGLFIGIRPLIKLFSGKTNIKELLSKFLYFKYDFYEIKKSNI